MKNQFLGNMEENFSLIGTKIFNELKAGEDLTLNINGEESLFIRFNNAKIRQTTHIHQAYLGMTFICDEKKIESNLAFSGNLETDFENAKKFLLKFRTEYSNLPKDPFITPIKNNGTSHENKFGKLPNDSTVIDEMFSELPKMEINGYLTSGVVFEGNQNSKGQKHWYSGESFFVDFSIFNPEKKAVKATYAGTHWDKNAFHKTAKDAFEKLKLMDRPSKKINPGKYRVYLAPAAASDLLGMYSWGCTGIGSLKRGFSPMLKVESGEKSFSSLFNFTEDYTLGLAPRFNEVGEVAPEKLPLIKNGKVENYLISARSAKEYNLESNNASEQETPRSFRMAAGNLKEEDVLKELGTGLYLSNLHYLNYSDRPSGRITGMTRYACFWVENGKIVAPIEDLRFDETLFNIFGDNLKDVTNFTEISPSTSTYFGRDLSGSENPGIIVDDFTFNL